MFILKSQCYINYYAIINLSICVIHRSLVSLIYRDEKPFHQKPNTFIARRCIILLFLGMCKTYRVSRSSRAKATSFLNPAWRIADAIEQSKESRFRQRRERDGENVSVSVNNTVTSSPTYVCICANERDSYNCRGCLKSPVVKPRDEFPWTRFLLTLTPHLICLSPLLHPFRLHNSALRSGATAESSFRALGPLLNRYLDRAWDA